MDKPMFESKMLWADLSRNEAQVEWPAWHGEVLREREARVRSGAEKYVDWETAKKLLREKLHGQ